MSENTENQYLLLIRGGDWYNHCSAEELQVAMNKFEGWFEKMNQRGVVRGGQPLQPEGKIVAGSGTRVLADGPYAESKEAIGGYFLIAVDTLDEAVAIAESSPMIEYGGSIEVRPIAESCPLSKRAVELAPELATAGA